MYSINCFILIARVITVANCGSYLIRTLTVFALLGGKVYDAFGNFLPTRTVVSSLLLVIAYLFSMNCVAVFLILLAPVLNTFVLLFASSLIVELYTLAAVRPSGKTFCIVLNVIIVPIIIFFLVQLTAL